VLLGLTDTFLEVGTYIMPCPCFIVAYKKARIDFLSFVGYIKMHVSSSWPGTLYQLHMAIRTKAGNLNCVHSPMCSHVGCAVHVPHFFPINDGVSERLDDFEELG